MVSAGPSLSTLALTSVDGMELRVLDLGATLQRLSVPTRQGHVQVVLAYEQLTDYLQDANYLGATVGRYANRICQAQCTVGGQRLALQVNEPATGNCLHGGEDGFHRQRWRLTYGAEGRSIVAHHRSPDGAGGFPGTLEASVTYELVAPLSLMIRFHAVSDRETVLSLTNHTYFNLSPQEPTVDGHRVRLDATHYTPTDARQIPTGEVAQVRGTDFDLRHLSPLANGSRPARYDHNFVVSGEEGTLRPAAEVLAPATGLRMRVSTTQAGIQLYTGDGLSPPFMPRAGLCLETQNFPDAPNHAHFPSPVLSPGHVYEHTSLFEFSE